MTRALDVLVDGKLIGHLYDKDPLAFAYSDDVLNGLLRSPFSSVIALAPGDIAMFVPTSNCSRRPKIVDPSTCPKNPGAARALAGFAWLS